MKPLAVDASKLFNVLVIGGMSLAIPACSGGPTTDSDAGGPAADAADDQGAQGNDAAAQPDTGTGQDAGCLNKPGDCTHGLCSW